MNYDLTLTDSTTSQTFNSAEIPITTTPVEIGTDVQVLSGNIYTDFIAQKRAWTRTFTNMPKDEFDLLKGFYDRQFTLYEYPHLTIVDDDASDIPVRMTFSGTNIIDNCGLTQEVTVSFRETKNLGS